MQKGLTEKKAKQLYGQFGPNIMAVRETPSWLYILWSQLRNPLIYILISVGIISIFLNEYIDALLILIVTVLNVIIGFIQEYKAQKTLTALRTYLKPMATVIREGIKKEIEARYLVPGDIVMLNLGDKVPADGFLLECNNLLINEAILTGESEPIGKDLSAENNQIFMGTTIVLGHGLMQVSKTGLATEIGKIGKSLAEIKEVKTPIQMRLEKFSKTLAKFVLLICAIIFIVGLVYGQDFFQMLGISIVLSVSAIPEAMPVAITVILALGMKRILQKNGLVKKLISIETLGSTSIICTDKTGTLTEGSMKIVKGEMTDKNLAHLGLILTNNQKSNVEVAIWDYLKDKITEDLFEITEKYPRLNEEAFDSAKKYSGVTINLNGKETSFILGAPDIILNFCHIHSEEKKLLIKKFEDWASRGLKLIGLVYKTDGNLQDKESYKWLGFWGIEDPIRPEAKEMISVANKAGIEVKIVTGDYRKTAEFVAKNLGMKITGHNVLEGKEFEILSGSRLVEAVKQSTIFTRVTPQQKLKIVEILQNEGEIIAMTGDGVNDAPALKKANIGVVVGNATEVAKETADLILLDSNFKTIISAIEEGRLILSNIKKVVGYVLSNSFEEIVIIFSAMLLNLPTPLTIAQILWINLICDGPPDLALGFEPKEKGLMLIKSKEIKEETFLSNYMKFLIIAISLTIGLMTLGIFYYFYKISNNLPLARTITFASFSAVSLFYIFSFKNLKKFVLASENLFANPYLYFSLLYGIILIIASVYLPILNKVLETVPLKLEHWFWVITIGLTATAWVEIVKYFSHKRL
ncbi:HAD-IC family P-type ATPase [Candidatus Falkowbacteria bacterium]|nr:HAD-IC family P-type ATPase [Candidatus Falkowbacteria bacterium]